MPKLPSRKTYAAKVYFRRRLIEEALIHTDSSDGVPQFFQDTFDAIYIDIEEVDPSRPYMPEAKKNEILKKLIWKKEE